MGAINGQEPTSITNINSVSSTSIVNINGHSAGEIGFIFGRDIRFITLAGTFRNPSDACGYGGGGTNYYFDMSSFYAYGSMIGVQLFIDSGLTTPMNGGRLWWYSIDTDAPISLFTELLIDAYGQIQDDQDVC